MRISRLTLVSSTVLLFAITFFNFIAQIRLKSRPLSDGVLEDAISLQDSEIFNPIYESVNGTDFIWQYPPFHAVKPVKGIQALHSIVL